VEKPQQVIRKEKVGRNDPCPCGSGKKYKKCHGAGSSGPEASIVAKPQSGGPAKPESSAKA